MSALPQPFRTFMNGVDNRVFPLPIAIFISDSSKYLPHGYSEPLRVEMQYGTLDNREELDSLGRVLRVEFPEDPWHRTNGPEHGGKQLTYYRAERDGLVFTVSIYQPVDHDMLFPVEI